MVRQLTPSLPLLLILLSLLLLAFYDHASPILSTPTTFATHATQKSITLPLDVLTLHACTLSLKGPNLPSPYAFENVAPEDVVAAYAGAASILLTCGGVEFSNTLQHAGGSGVGSFVGAFLESVQGVGIWMVLVVGLGVWVCGAGAGGSGRGRGMEKGDAGREAETRAPGSSGELEGKSALDPVSTEEFAAKSALVHEAPAIMRRWTSDCPYTPKKGLDLRLRGRKCRAMSAPW